MVTDNLVDLSMLLTLISHFYFMQLQGVKNRPLLYISRKQRMFLCWSHNFTVCQQTQKKSTYGWQKISYC